MNTLRGEVLPTWAAGVELRQTTLSCVQVVGDVPNPVALQGVGATGLAWLQQLDGQRSWVSQVSEADARGVAVPHALEMLEQLFDGGLLVDARTTEHVSLFARPVVVGSGDLAEHVVRLVPGAQFAFPIPKPRDGSGWRVEAERVADEVGSSPTIVVLDGPSIDAAEFEFVAGLIDRKVNHVVVGSGANTARVGPLTIDGRGPCSRCDEILRVDLDPSWRQLAAHAALDGSPARSNVLALLAAAEVARQLASITPDGQVAALNAVLTSGHSGSAWVRRPLQRHRKCACWWRSVGES